MRVKICGITKPEQAKAIASLGATAIGFICVPTSPRYLGMDKIRAVVEQLPPQVDKIGVFANASVEKIVQIVVDCQLTGVQLHADESPAFCQKLRDRLPGVEIIKALRMRTAADLDKATVYSLHADALLFDAYHPQQLGGTGQTLHWEMLRNFCPSYSWFLAGGITPDNVLEALSQVNPNGIDLSSGVERSPGDKDLHKVAKLFERLRVQS